MKLPRRTKKLCHFWATLYTVKRLFLSNFKLICPCLVPPSPSTYNIYSADMVHSVSWWTRGVREKMWDPLRTRARLPERLEVCSRRGAIQIHFYLYLPSGRKFPQLQYYRILLKSVNIWPSNHKCEVGKLFRDTVYKRIRTFSRRFVRS